MAASSNALGMGATRSGIASTAAASSPSAPVRSGTNAEVHSTGERSGGGAPGAVAGAVRSARSGSAQGSSAARKRAASTASARACWRKYSATRRSAKVCRPRPAASGGGRPGSGSVATSARTAASCRGSSTVSVARPTARRTPSGVRAVRAPASSVLSGGPSGTNRFNRYSRARKRPTKNKFARTRVDPRRICASPGPCSRTSKGSMRARASICAAGVSLKAFANRLPFRAN